MTDPVAAFAAEVGPAAAGPVVAGPTSAVKAATGSVPEGVWV